MTAPATHRVEPVPFTGQEGTDGGDEIFILLPGGVRMIFCWCPRPGQPFQIGSPGSEAARSSDEAPAWINLSQGFWLAKHLCSQAQWMADPKGKKNPSHFSATPEQPVEQISWQDASTFCREAGSHSGWQLALPTEAQWEYACRAGSGISQPFAIGEGNALNSQMANFNGSSPYGGSFEWHSRQRTLPAGAFPPNAWGLHDMHGQLWEWCADWGAEYAMSSAQQPLGDPSGPPSGANRVLRGGSWFINGRCCRAAFRYGFDPCNYFAYAGFRPALVPELASGAGSSAGERRGTSRKAR